MSQLTRTTHHASRSSRLRNRNGVVVAAVAGAEFVLTGIAALSPGLAIAITGLTAVAALSLVFPIFLMVLAFPATFATWRIGPSAIDMSLSDALSFAALAAALPYVPWRNKSFRQATLVTAGYTAAIAISTASNPYQGAIIEVVHRFVLVMGSICVGAALARLGHARAAMRSLFAAGTVLSVATIQFTLTHHLQPGYPFGLQKNTTGSLLTMLFLALLLAPQLAALSRRVSIPLGALFLAGLAASQSRGAGLALIIVFVLYVIRNGWHRQGRHLAKLFPIFFVVAIGMLTITVVTYETRDAVKTGRAEQFNTVGSRTKVYDEAIGTVWGEHKMFGAGLKWFYQPTYHSGTPHNLIIEELSEVGIFGTAALLIFLYGLLRVSWRAGGDVGRMAWYVLLQRILHSLVDIFWAAGPGTLPYLFIGLAIGEEAKNEERASFEANLVGRR